MRSLRSGLIGYFVVLSCLAGSVHAAEKPGGLHLTIASGQFKPSKITIPAEQQVKLMVHNTTALPAEFESDDFTAEKVIPGHTEIPVYIGPLDKGSYSFFNDFAQNMTGTLVVK